MFLSHFSFKDAMSLYLSSLSESGWGLRHPMRSVVAALEGTSIILIPHERMCPSSDGLPIFCLL